jgi:hypothetical protein
LYHNNITTIILSTIQYKYILKNSPDGWKLPELFENLFSVYIS